MPRIREYDRQFGDVRGPIQQRARTPDDFGAREARGIRQLAGAVGEAGDLLYRKAEQDELSDLNAKLSQVQKENTLEYEKLVRSANPGDKEIFKDFDQKARERIDKVGEGLSTRGGREYYKKTSLDLKNQMQVSAARVQADLDGEKAVLDYTSTVNNLSSSLLSDPSNLDSNVNMHEAAIDNLVNSGMLPASEGAKLKMSGKKDLTKSSLRGWMKLNPEFAKERINSGEYDETLGGQLKVQMLGEADQAIRAKEIEAERKKRRDEELKKERQLQTQDKFIRKLAEGDLTLDEVMADNTLDAFGSGSKQQFMNMMKSRNVSGPPKDNPAVFTALLERIHAPDGDPNKITDENELLSYVGKGISMSSLNHLRGEVQGTKSAEGKQRTVMKKQTFNFAKARLSKSNPMLGIRDPEGEERLLAFQTFVFELENQFKKEGKPIRDLYNPNSKEYVGQYLPQFQGTLQDIMKANMKLLAPSMANDLSGGKPKKEIVPRQPGESAKDYLDRIKGTPKAEAGQ